MIFKSTRGRRGWGGLCMVLTLVPIGPVAHAEDPPPPAALALDLAREGDHAGAALEFRRLALEAADDGARSGFFWAAACEYGAAGRPDTADKMLDAVEESAGGDLAPALILRSRHAAARAAWNEEAFYLESVLHGQTAAEERNYAARKLAAARLRQGRLDEARRALAGLEPPAADGLQALDQFAGGRDRSPAVGGWLGLVPGLGYAYAGEYASGVRSLLLNGLFIFGMAQTASDEQWGAFGVICFFEITWYSGSIYGGIDASQRFNRTRLDRAVRGVEGDTGFTPDYNRLPAMILRFRF